MPYLDRSDFCSLYVAVDDFYLNKLLHSYRTWVELKPETLRMPHVFVYDAVQVRPSDARWGELERMFNLALSRHRTAGVPHLEGLRFTPTLVPWRMEASSQRERMLTSLIRSSPKVWTPWYLKLDADTFAQAPGGWYYDRWFSGNPCYISSPWGYTKPGGTIAQMNRWASTVPQLQSFPEVQCSTVTLAPGKTKDVHPRMASWVQFGNTEWTKWANGLCQGDRLPFPSQDTYLSYIQARTGKNWVPVKFRQFGFEHMKQPDKLASVCREVLLKHVGSLQ